MANPTSEEDAHPYDTLSQEDRERFHEAGVQWKAWSAGDPIPSEWECDWACEPFHVARLLIAEYDGQLVPLCPRTFASRDHPRPGDDRWWKDVSSWSIVHSADLGARDMLDEGGGSDTGSV